MKTQLFKLSLLIAFVFFTQFANAKIRRIGFFANQIPGTDYPNLQSGQDSSKAGDTILVFPGVWSATFTKRLVICGYGYLVTGAGSNPDSQAVKGALAITINLGTGSDSTILEGLDGMQLNANPNIPHSSIFVNRCNGSISFYNTAINNWQIKQCSITLGTAYPYSGTVFTNISVENSFINTCDLRLMNPSSTGIFNNDIFWTGTNNFNNGNYTLVNNIFYGTGGSAPTSVANCVFYNNIGTGNTIPADVNNKPNVVLTTIFAGYPTQGTYSLDSRWKLAPGSPAIAAGIGGTDCGIFGGTSPYRLSGIPSIPSFYKISAPSPIVSTNPFILTFSVRSNN